MTHVVIRLERRSRRFARPWQASAVGCVSFHLSVVFHLRWLVEPVPLFQGPAFLSTFRHDAARNDFDK